MVKLFCAIVDVAGSAFSVEVNQTDSVDVLKKAIRAKNANDLKDVDAKNLQLFLAKTERGEWLDGAGAASVALDKRGHPRDCVQMDPTRWIKNPKHFGDNFQPGEGQVHVLVVVPEGAGSFASETSKIDQLVQEVHEIHAQTVLTKRKRYVLSKVTSSQGKQLLRDLNIKVSTVRTVPFPVGMGSPVGGFGWESVIVENGEKNCAYRRSATRTVSSLRGAQYWRCAGGEAACVVGVENGQDILTVEVPGYDIELSGRTDRLVLSDIITDNPPDLQYKMPIEVKKDVKPSCDFQALSELIALDLLADDPVVALLTDLNGSWLLFWVSEKKKNNSVRIQKATIKNPGDAFEVIKALLAQPPPPADTDTVTEIELPCFQRPVKRLKLREALPPIGEGGESGGIRESIERYYDIASMLGPDIEMVRAVARQVTRSIPTLSYIS